MKKYSLYIIRNTKNGKIYIGQTTLNPRNRWNTHTCDFRKGKHCNKYFQRSWDKYGSSAFSFEVLRDDFKNICELNIAEMFYISKYNSTNPDYGYNLMIGGRNCKQPEHVGKAVAESNRRRKGIKRGSPSKETVKKIKNSLQKPLHEWLENPQRKDQFKRMCIKRGLDISSFEMTFAYSKKVGNRLRKFYHFKNSNMNISENFDVREFVDPSTYKKFGNASRWFVSTILVDVAQELRNEFGVVTINSWHWGGQYKESGLRNPLTSTGARYSAHKFGLAADLKFKDHTPKEVYDKILENKDKWLKLGLTVLEDVECTPTWLHVDVRNTGMDDIMIVRP